MPLAADDRARRLTAWRAEADATSDRGDKAAIWYEIGNLLEGGGDESAAVDAHDQARKLSPGFRPALWALLRLHERRRDTDALAALYAAEGRAAKDPAEEASALVDQAALYEDFLGRRGQAVPLYERAQKIDPKSLAAALMLELSLRRSGNAVAAMHVAAARAAHVHEPVLRRLLYMEAALAREADGEVDEALEFLRTMTKEPLERWRMLETFEAIARRQGREDAIREAIGRMAQIAEARARGDAMGQTLTAASLPPFASDRHARDAAVVLWHELGRRAGDVEALGRALALRPKDPVLLLERVELGDVQAARDAAAALGGAQAAAMHLRVADGARASGDAKGEKSALAAAAAAAPGSPAVCAVVQERLLAASAPAERIRWLEERADAGGGVALWQAASIAVEALADPERARDLFERACAAMSDPEPVLREMVGAGLRLGAEALVDVGSRGLVDVTADETERAQLLFERYRQRRRSDAPDPLAPLRDAISDPAASFWAADVARVEAAGGGDHELLARAHGALGERSADEQSACAHLCAVGRALARAGRPDEAIEALSAARARAPNAPYAAALLEEVLRACGRDAEAIELLREAARAAESGRDAEPLLLRAALLAEGAGDAPLAATLLCEAAERSPKSVAPLAQMRSLATRTGDRDLEHRALEAMVAREGDRAGRAHLALAEHLLAVGADPDRAVALLRAGFADDEVGPVAAATLLLALDHEDEAIGRLLRDARGLGGAGLRRRLGVVLRGGPRDREVRALLPRIREVRKDDRWALWVSLAQAGTGRDAAAARIDALEALASATGDAQLRPELLLEARVLVAVVGGADAASRERALGDRIAEASGDSVLAAFVRDESWCAEDDPSDRAARLEARARHTSTELRPQIAAALGRALVLAGDSIRAVSALRDALAREPDDLASWEAMCVAAREAEAWAELVPACERLSALAGGAPRARLLEEAAVTLLDRLDRRADAERRLRGALAADPASPTAYRRLHEILSERGDAQALLDLVSARVEAVDDPAELGLLFDEQARLRHARGDLEGTVESLRNLQVLDPGNAGALALLAETTARLERWEDSVQTLRSLSCVDIPAPERRQARLAASRYAREKLGDVDGALADLRVIDGMGLADEALHVQTAEVAEAAGKLAEAARALARAAETAADPADRARYERRAAELYTDLLDAEAAVAAYERALRAAPTDLASAEGLAALLEGESRREAARAFQDAVRERLEQQPTSPGLLRKLRRSTTWCGERDLELRCLAALSALGLASPDEQAAFESLRASAPAHRHAGTLGAEREALCPEPLDASLRAIVAAADDAVATADGVTPDALGVGRRDVIKDKQESSLRDAVLSVASLFDAGSERFFEGGNDPAGIEVAAQADKPPAWIVGAEVTAPLSPAHGFRVASLAMAAASGTTCLLRRTVDEGVALLAAIGRASDARLGEAAGADELAAALRKALSRKARKAIADHARSAPTEPHALRAFCRAARLAALRAGLAVSGDLGAALEAAQPDEREELLRLWLSERALSIRRALGTALDDAEVGHIDTSEATAERAAIPATHGISIERLLEQVVAANPYAAKAAAGHAEVVGGAPTRRERVQLLLQLAEHEKGRVRARLSVAAAEILATIGGEEPAEALLAEALEHDPDDVVALRRVRAARARAGDFDAAVRLLEREAALPVTPEERSFALTLASFLSLHAGGDAAAAENAARRAFMIRPRSAGAAAWLALTQRAVGSDGDAAQTLERAASATNDGALGAVWLAEVAREAERAGDHARARRLYRQAHRLDPEAIDAAVGLARTALFDGDPRESGRAMAEVAALLTDPLLREAFVVVGARTLHHAAGQPADAVRMLAGVDGPHAALARAEAARDRKDDRARQEALRARAEASRRTERALAFIELAEARAASGEVDAALEALREAGHADQTIATLRVLREELERRTGDPLRLARATRAAGNGPLVAAARTVLVPDALELERSLVRQADPADRTAAALALDAAAEAGDRLAMGELMSGVGVGSGAALALADHHLREGRRDEAITALAAARDRDPDEATVRRWVAVLSPAAEAAPLWLEEARAAGGTRAAFAATTAARLFAKVGDADAASEALRVALEASPGYPPALWAMEERAKEGGRLGDLRELMSRRADDSADADGAAEVLVRAALVGGRPDPALLARAHEAAPGDPVLADLRLRAAPDAPPAERAGLWASMAESAGEAWAPAFRLRAAWLFEQGEMYAEAAEQARLARAADAGPFAERLLDRVEPRAGALDEAAERLVEATERAPDDISRALAFERYAAFEEHVRGDLEAAANPLYGILEQYPGHAASLRALERIFMTVDDDVRLQEVEERLAALGHPKDAAAHARLAARIALRAVGAEVNAADEALRRTFDYAEVDLWLLRRLEAMARGASDTRLLGQVLGEMAERTDDDRERTALELRRAEAVAEARSPSAALGTLRRLTRETKGYPLLEEQVAYVSLAAGATEDAAEALEDAAGRSKAPARRCALWYEAGLLWEGTVVDRARAAAAYSEAAAEDLGYADVFERLRALLPQIGQQEKLAGLVRRALESTRGDKQRLVELHLLLAELSRELGDLGAAKKSLRTVATMEPRNADALDRLARVCQAEEDWRGAIDALQRITRATQEPEILHPVLLQLGDLYARTRNVPRAEATYRQALELFPDDAAAKERLDSVRTPRRT